MPKPPVGDSRFSSLRLLVGTRWLMSFLNYVDTYISMPSFFLRNGEVYGFAFASKGKGKKEKKSLTEFRVTREKW